MALRPATRTAVIRIAGSVMAFVGAVSFAGVVGFFGDVGHAVKHNPLGGVAIVAGLALLAWGYRDSMLAAIGIVSTTRAASHVRDWLVADGYNIKQLQAPPDFKFQATDPFKTSFLVYTDETFNETEVWVSGAMEFTAEHKESMRSATRPDLRSLQTRLFTALLADGGLINVELHNFESAINGGANGPETIIAIFQTAIRLSELNQRSFALGIHAVRKGIVLAGPIMADVAEQIASRSPKAADD